MKRKLFTLLVAFVALVAFQANAQTTDGAWYWIDTKSPTDAGVPGISGANFASPIPDNELNGAFRVTAANAPILNVKGDTHDDFMLGDYSRYFKIKRVGTSMTFTMQSRVSNGLMSLSYNGTTFTNFEFVRFQFIVGATAGGGIATFPGEARTIAPLEDAGGYVCAPTTNGTGGTAGRVYVVVNQKTGAMSLMDDAQLTAANANALADAINASIPIANKRPYYSRLWARAYQIGGHWATIHDFKNTDFVKFQLGNQYLFANDNHSGRAFDVFRVDAVGFIQSDKTESGNTPSWTISPGGGTLVDTYNALWSGSGLLGNWTNLAATTSPKVGLQGLQNIGSGTTSNWVLPIFSIRTSDDSCKYLSVKQENPIYSSEQAVLTAYSDRLEVRNYGEYFDTTATRMNYVRPTNMPANGDLSNSALYSDDVRNSVKSQVWAVWIDNDGNMSIYPAGAYVYDPTIHHNNKPNNFSINEALIQNAWNVAFDGGIYGLSYKIGQRDDDNTRFCLTPVTNFSPTYKNGLFIETDWTEYNAIPEGRYFFLETQNMPFLKSSQMVRANGENRNYVLSVQPIFDQGGTNEWYKKIVMVPKEDVILAPGTTQPANDYSTYPLDSVIMSAHWEVKKVIYNDVEVGYRFVNELGDTLQYNPELGTFTGGATLLYNTDVSDYTALSGGVVNFQHPNFPAWVYGHPENDIYSTAGPRPNGFSSLAVTDRGGFSPYDFTTYPNPIFAGPYPGAAQKSYYTPDPLLAPSPDTNLVRSTAWQARDIYYDAWKSIKRKGDSGNYVYLRLNYYGDAAVLPGDWAKYQVNLDTLNDFDVTGTTVVDGIYNSGWYGGSPDPATGTGWYGLPGYRAPRVSNITKSQVYDYYQQRDVIAWPRDIDTYPLDRIYPGTFPANQREAIFGGSCTHGIAVKLTPVEYEYNGGIYNDASTADYYQQDSLTAYKYKEGYYNITEAVELNLSIGVANLNAGTPAEMKDVAVMQPTGALNSISIEPVGTERNQLFTLVVDTTNVTMPVGKTLADFRINASAGIGQYFNGDSIAADALYGDPYKWHYIKYNDMYLVFDTINPLATTEDLMYGFRFKKTDRLNATPFRLYQPLVGDKVNENFIMQFIVPSYYYALDPRDGHIIYEKSYALNFQNQTPNTDIDFAGNGTFGQNSPKGGTKVRFVKFNKQTGPLYVTKDVRSKATRFTFTIQGKPSCEQEFVYVNYLMDNGMYRLPITAEIYEKGNPIDWFISGSYNGAATEQETKDKAENIRFTLADTLHMYDDHYGATDKWAGIGAYRWLGSPSSLSSALDTAQCRWYYGYEPYSYGSTSQRYNTVKKDVHLFYIQNSAGEFLTVINETAATQNVYQTTNPDVYGTKLAWKSAKYTYTNKDYKDGKVDLRPLQMFAIHGCLTTEKPYGEFVILPVASYVMDYITKKPVGIDNNVNLGVYEFGGYSTVTSAFRISRIGRGDKPTMIVVPGNKDFNTTVPADEFKFTPEQNYAGPFCYHNFIQNTTDTVSIKGKPYYGYYGADQYYSRPDSAKPIMHWTFNPVQGKNSLYTVSQELKTWRGMDIKNEMLKEQYYLVETQGSDFDQNKTGHFEIFSREHPEWRSIFNVDITCLDAQNHDVVCDNRPVDGCYDNYYRFCDQTLTSTEFGIIEGDVYNDRYIWTAEPIDGGITNAICPQLAKGESAQYLKIEKSWVRPVSEHHSIPYYNIVRHVNNKDYYLEVVIDPITKKPTDVRFRVPTASELKILREVDKNPTALPGFKFCFPYRLDENGHRMAPNPNYKDRLDLHQVYAQTLDTGLVSTNMLQATVLKIMYDSQTLEAVQIDSSYYGTNKAGSYDYDILTIDYTAMDKLEATTWFFGDDGGASYEWVELAGVKNEGNKDTEGWMSGASSGTGTGNVFAVASGASPVNYGILDAYSKTGPDMKLTFEFEGDTVIGSYTMRPIWYYRIKNANGMYLTNAVDSTKSIYKWSEGKPYGFFGGIVPNDPTNPITADANYDQTFGLRHIPVDLQPGGVENQYFWVVSRVDYRVGSYGEYYYLSQINDRLVFTKADLNNPTEVYSHAMMFQLGSVDNDGKYTDVDKVGDGAVKVYGIDGAVKVVNAKGAIELYTIDGRKFNTVIANGTEQVIAAPRGVIIVKNGTKVEKVIVK